MFVFSLLVVLGVNELSAQPVPTRMPGSTHIFPAGARRGTAVDVRVGAECIPPGTNFYLSGQGVSAPDVLGSKLALRGELSPRRLPTEIPICYPKEWQSRVEIAADAPLGPAYWRLSCAQGGTGSRPFIVGELPEFIETESNSLPERAERVEMPVTINGQICGERDADYFRLAPRGGEIVVCEVLAARLGSALDPLVDILDAAGKPVEIVRRSAGSDVVLAFRTAASREYLLRVANVTQHGSPAHVYRINVTSAASFEAAFPREDETGVVAVKEPNETAEKAYKVGLPTIISGKFSGRQAEDWFQFAGQAEQPVSILCRASPVGGLALPTLLLTDSGGKELARARSVDSADGVCRLDWKPPAAGDYRLRVRDLRLASPDADGFAYRLEIRAAQPDFSLSLATDCVNVVQGGKVQFDVAVQRAGGFAGPIDLRLDGIPEGVTLETTKIPEGAANIKLTLAASDEAASASSVLRLVGRAAVGERQIERTAQARHLGVDALGVAIGSPTLDRLHLTVGHKPVFRLQCAEAYQYAHRGTIYPYLMEIERLNGFDGPITLQPGDRQNRDLDGIEIQQIVAQPDQTQIMVLIYLPETMHINVQGQSQLYTQGHASFVDKHGRQQAVLVVSEKRNMLRTLPPVVKLKTVQRQVSAAPGAACVCRFELDRTSNFAGPMEVELISSPEGPKIACEKAAVAAGQTSFELPVQLPADAPRGATLTLRFRAVGKLTDSVSTVSEDELRLTVE